MNTSAERSLVTVGTFGNDFILPFDDRVGLPDRRSELPGVFVVPVIALLLLVYRSLLVMLEVTCRRPFSILIS